MHKDGKFSDGGRARQKYCCPFKRSKCGECPCNRSNWNNGKKNQAAQNTLQFLMTIDYLYTAVAFHLKPYMLLEPNVNATQG